MWIFSGQYSTLKETNETVSNIIHMSMKCFYHALWRGESWVSTIVPMSEKKPGLVECYPSILWGSYKIIQSGNSSYVSEMITFLKPLRCTPWTWMSLADYLKLWYFFVVLHQNNLKGHGVGWMCKQQIWISVKWIMLQLHFPGCSGHTCPARPAGSLQLQWAPPQRWESCWGACARCCRHKRGSCGAPRWTCADHWWRLASSPPVLSGCHSPHHSSGKRQRKKVRMAVNKSNLFV